MSSNHAVRNHVSGINIELRTQFSKVMLTPQSSIVYTVLDCKDGGEAVQILGPEFPSCVKAADARNPLSKTFESFEVVPAIFDRL